MSESHQMHNLKTFEKEDERHNAISHFTPSTDTNRSFAKMHPRHRTFALWYDRYMILIALLASTVVYLQAALILSNKSSENVSLPSFIIWLIVSLSVLLYGILWTDWVLATTGIVASLGAIIALVACISFRPVSSSGAFVI
jgi:uncharacterized protein with PQ loop repeat